jgi:two-component system, OmpR family, alkaline phosphatase synthesis response regulator PhoP
MSHILVVEDEAHLANGLRFNLEAEGHTIEISDNGEDALRWLLVEKQQFDAVVLDVMLPGKDGFTVASELREAQHFIPILMLTARSRPEDVLRGFESGADDYLPKPFNLAILIARIGSLLRRKQWLANGSAPAATESTNGDSFEFADKKVDFQKLQLRSGKKVYQLTLMESDLLRYLIQNSGRPVTRKEILEKVWNLHEDTDTRAIDNFIVRLRRYIEDEPTKPKHLVTIRGLGYEFVAEPKKS